MATKNEYILRQWTIEEALERAAKPPPRTANASRRNKDYWAGETYETAMQMANTGDPKSALGLKKYLGILARVRQANRTMARWGESGSTVDVARFLSGEPESMIEIVKARRATPVLKIGIERAVSHYVDAEEMRATGASVLAVVEALRTAGIAAEIWTTFTIGGWGGTKLSTQVLVQEAGRPIDVESANWRL